MRQHEPPLAAVLWRSMSAIRSCSWCARAVNRASASRRRRRYSSATRCRRDSLGEPFNLLLQRRLSLHEVRPSGLAFLRQPMPARAWPIARAIISGVSSNWHRSRQTRSSRAVAGMKRATAHPRGAQVVVVRQT